MSTHTRGGNRRAPYCPACGTRLRVKPQPRTVLLQVWQCSNCMKTKPANECQWTNSGLELAAADAEDAAWVEQSQRTLDQIDANDSL